MDVAFNDKTEKESMRVTPFNDKTESMRVTPFSLCLVNEKSLNLEKTKSSESICIAINLCIHQLSICIVINLCIHQLIFALDSENDGDMGVWKKSNFEVDI